MVFEFQLGIERRQLPYLFQQLTSLQRASSPRQTTARPPQRFRGLPRIAEGCTIALTPFVNMARSNCDRSTTVNNRVSASVFLGMFRKTAQSSNTLLITMRHIASQSLCRQFMKSIARELQDSVRPCDPRMGYPEFKSPCIGDQTRLVPFHLATSRGCSLPSRTVPPSLQAPSEVRA